MISVEAWTTIRYLHAQGKSIRTIAEEVGVARNTVRAALRAENRPRYRRPGRPNAQLTALDATIRRLLFEEELIGSRILREVRAAGYAGGATAFYDYLRSLKTASLPRAVERFETAPGEQGQFDWSPYTVELGGQPVKLVVYSLTLGYSRRKCFWPSLSEAQPAIFEAIQAGFRHFGGVPKTLLLDNPRALVSNPHPAHFRWNPAFLELCGHYGVQPVACQPARPQTKGKVERPFYYLEQQFIKGQTWADFDAFHRDLDRFVAEDVDVRVHGTTGEAPIVRFTREAAALTPLPTTPFLSSREVLRTVSRDCLVAFGGNRYSVPSAYAGQPVWVRPIQGVRLEVRSAAGEPIVTLALATTKGQTILDPAHYADLRERRPTTKARVTAAFLARFPGREWFVEGVTRQHRPNAVAHLQGILTLAELYPTDAVAAALATSRQFGAYSQRFIRGLLLGDPLGPSASPSPAPVGAPGAAVTADLGIYQQLLEAVAP